MTEQVSEDYSNWNSKKSLDKYYEKSDALKWMAHRINHMIIVGSLEYYAYFGDIFSLQLTIDEHIKANNQKTQFPIIAAALNRNMDAGSALSSREYPINSLVYEAVLFADDPKESAVSYFRKFKEIGVTITDPNMIYMRAAWLGDMEVMEWMKDNDYKIEDSAFIGAISNVNSPIRMINWCIDNGGKYPAELCICTAISEDKIDLVRELIRISTSKLGEICMVAAIKYTKNRGDSITMINSLLDSRAGCEAGITCTSVAACNAELPVLELLHTRGIPFNEYA
jgi:hypothetical protein